MRSLIKRPLPDYTEWQGEPSTSLEVRKYDNYSDQHADQEHHNGRQTNCTYHKRKQRFSLLVTTLRQQGLQFRDPQSQDAGSMSHILTSHNTKYPFIAIKHVLVESLDAGITFIVFNAPSRGTAANILYILYF